MNFVTAKEAKQLLHISPVTLMNWRQSGKIKSKQLSSKKILYDIDSVDMTNDTTESNKLNVIYVRVSTNRQKEDLNHQIETIKSFMLAAGVKPDLVFSDIASGMNESRKQFNQLLELVFQHKVDTVYIIFKDRLSRFGFEYFRHIFNWFGTKIEILDNNEESNKTYQQELTEDLIAIIHSYSMKLQNKKLKEIEKLLEDDYK